MATLRRSPFKADKVENDPNAFGLRVKEIIACAESLFNDRSILISGPRGIGKSSLGNQLQKMLGGDQTLLKRCGIKAIFPKTLCVFYACDQKNTLDRLALDILFNIEQRYLNLPDLQALDLKPSFELNLGLIKASLEMSTKIEERSPATIANQLVAGLSNTFTLLNKLQDYQCINIMIDELDQISSDVNFGHFMKIVHETLVSLDLNQITFILAGQQGVYTRLINEDPSFERIVRHVPLTILDGDASEHVLSYATSRAKPPFRYDSKARDLILSLSSGYPYNLHLIGDAAFSAMEDDEKMSRADVLNGVEIVLTSDKREKYLDRLREISNDERKVILTMSEFPTNTVPAEVPMSWLASKLSSYFNDNEILENTMNTLSEKGLLVTLKNRLNYRFGDELLRVFVSLSRIEQQELLLKKSEKTKKRKTELEDEDALLKALLAGEDGLWKYLSEADQKQSVQRVRKYLETSTYNADWDTDDMFSFEDEVELEVKEEEEEE